MVGDIKVEGSGVRGARLRRLAQRLLVVVCAAELMAWGLATPGLGVGRAPGRGGEAWCGVLCVYYAARMAGIDASVDHVAVECGTKPGTVASFTDLARAVHRLGGQAVPVECTLAQLYAWNLPAVLHLQSPIGPPVLDGREQKPQKDHFALFVGMASQGDPRFFDPGVNHLWLIKRNPLDLRAWDDNLEKLYRKRALLVAFPPWELPKEVREALEKRGEWGPLAMSPSVRRIKSPQLSEERGHGTDTLAARSSDLRKQHASRIAAQVIEAREAELVEELGKAQANEKNEARRRELEGLLAIHKQRLATLRDGRKVFADAQGLMKGNDYRRAAELLVFFEDHVDYAPQGSLLALLALVGAEEDVRAMRLCCRLVEERRLKPELLHVGLQAAAGAATRRGDDAFLLWANGAMIQVDPTNELSGLAAWKLDGLHQKLADKGKASPASGQKGGRP